MIQPIAEAQNQVPIFLLHTENVLFTHNSECEYDQQQESIHFQGSKL